MTSAGPNVDPAELNKFESLASRWWDPHGEFKPLHEINPIRLRFIQDRVEIAGKNIIDVGCGGGILTESLAAAGGRVTGIDAGEAPLRVARLHLLESGAAVDYRRTTAEEHAQTHAGQYDVVTCLEMLEHVPDPASVVAACARLARPGSAVFFSTINRNPKSWLAAIVGAEYLLRLLPRGTHDYVKLIKPSELHGWARVAGLAAAEYTGMHYNPLTRRYRLGPGLDVNYLAYFIRTQ